MIGYTILEAGRESILLRKALNATLQSALEMIPGRAA